MDLLLPYIQLDVKYKNSCKDKFFAGILMRNLWKSIKKVDSIKQVKYNKNRDVGGKANVLLG